MARCFAFNYLISLKFISVYGGKELETPYLFSNGYPHIQTPFVFKNPSHANTIANFIYILYMLSFLRVCTFVYYYTVFSSISQVFFFCICHTFSITVSLEYLFFGIVDIQCSISFRCTKERI